MAYTPPTWTNGAPPPINAANLNALSQAVADLSTQVDEAVADYLALNPPTAVPDATNAVKGVIRLTGDLGGTAAVPTVPGLAGKADAGHTHDADTSVIYVSPTGSDTNLGTAITPKKTIAAAITAITADHGGVGIVQLRGNATYSASALTIDPHKVWIRGAPKAVISFSGLASGAAITFTNAAATTPPYTGGVCPLSDVTLTGPGEGSSVVGLRFQSPGAGLLAHLSLRDVRIGEFGVGVDYDDQAFCITFFNLTVHQCGRAVQVLSGGTNYGERLTFMGSTFFNNPVHIYARGGGTGLHLTNCSLDYGGTFVDADQARVSLTDCHVENYDTTADPIFTLGSDPYTSLTMIGGQLVFNGSTAIGSRPLSALITNTGGTVRFSDVFMSNLRTSGDTFVSGTGRTSVAGSVIPSNTEMPARQATSGALNPSVAIPDSASVVDPWYVLGSTDRLTGNDLTVTSTTSTGVRSTSIAKTTVPDGQALLLVPTPVESLVNFTFSYAVPTGSGTSYLTMQWVTNVTLLTPTDVTWLGDPLAQFAVVKSGSAIPWTEYAWGGARRPPKGATHLAIAWNSSGFANGAIHFKDVSVSAW